MPAGQPGSPKGRERRYHGGMEPTWHDGLSRKALVELVEGLLLAVDKSVPRLDAVAHHLVLDVPSRARSSRSWAGSATRSPTSATSCTRRATARSSGSGATRSTRRRRRTSSSSDRRHDSGSGPGPLRRLEASREPVIASARAGRGKTVGLVSLGLPEEPRGQRGDARAPAAARLRDRGRRARRRRDRRQHLRLHRPRQAGVGRHDPRDGAREGDGPGQAPRRHRLPGAALRRRPAPGDPRDRRDPRHGADRRHPARRGRRGRDAIRHGRPPGSTTTQSPRVLSTPSYMAYLKISEGCDYTCAFCIIPTLRGRHRSRPAGRHRRARRASLAARGVCARSSSWPRTRRGTASISGCATGSPSSCDALGHDRRAALDPRDVRLSGHHDRRDPGRDRGRGEGREVHRHSAPTRKPTRSSADEASDRAREPAGARGAMRDRVPGLTAAHVVHRRLSRGDRGRVRGAAGLREATEPSTMSASSPTPTRRARPRFDLPGRVSAEGQGESPSPAHGAPEEHLRAAEPAAGSGSASRCSSRGRTRRPTCFSRGRTAGQAPEIDGAVIINDGTAPPGASSTARSRRRTPTIWWRASFRLLEIS